MDISEEEREANTKLLIEAARYGDCEELRRLIPVSDSIKGLSGALSEALEYGRKECVELLIPLCDPKVGGVELLDNADYHGFDDIAVMLVPHFDCEMTLRIAARLGLSEEVKRIISLNLMQIYDSAALVESAIMSHKDIVEILIPVSDFEKAKIELLSWNAIEAYSLIEAVEAELQQKTLGGAIEEQYANAPSRGGRVM